MWGFCSSMVKIPFFLISSPPLSFLFLSSFSSSWKRPLYKKVFWLPLGAIHCNMQDREANHLKTPENHACKINETNIWIQKSSGGSSIIRVKDISNWSTKHILLVQLMYCITHTIPSSQFQNFTTKWKKKKKKKTLKFA